MLEILQKLVGAERVWAEEPMKDHTTFRAGGCARYLVEPEDAAQLSAVVNACREQDVPLLCRWEREQSSGQRRGL